MSRKYCFRRDRILIAIAFAFSAVMSSPALAATFNYTQGSVTYTVVEADPFVSGGVAGNTVNMNSPGQFFAQNAGGNINGLYSYRDFASLNFNAPAGKPAADRDLFEVASQDVLPPDLRTTVSGLPNGNYDVYLAMMTETLNPTNQLHPATLGANIDVGQARPTSLRGGRFQPGLTFTDFVVGGNYEVTLVPLGSVSGTSISVLVGPMWAGDLNRDGVNNQDDLNIVLSHWGQTVAPGDRSVGNTNDDTIINQADLNAVFYEAWGEKGYPPGRRGDYIGVAYKLQSAGTGSVVPEPASLMLLAVATIGVAACRRRRAKAIVTTSLLIAVISVGWAPNASAAINGWFAQVTTEEGDVPPVGMVSQDLTVNATTDWLASQLRIVLSSGTIYQDTGGGVPAPTYKGPDPANFPSFPTLRWDTYLTGSGGLAAASPSSAGAAIDIGGTNNISTGGKFDTSAIDVEWFTTSTLDTGTFTLGRFTLADSAQGTWQMRLDSLGQAAPVVLSGNVQNGLLLGTTPPTLGDYNGNGKVDAADYVLWRKNPAGFGGDPAGYTTWRANFGSGFGSGSGLVGGNSVPEPASAVVLMFALAALTSLTRMR